MAPSSMFVLFITKFFFFSRGHVKFYERVSGTLPASAYSRRGTVATNIFLGLIDHICDFREALVSDADEIDKMLIGNRIQKQSLVEIGVVTASEAFD